MTLSVKSLLTELIQCQSVTPNEGGALSLLQNVFNQNKFKCYKLNFGENEQMVENLFARFGEGEPHICFAGHTDVVPPGNIDSWTFPPFEGREFQDKIYGRGAVDMKGAIAAYISASIDWINTNKNFKGSISFLLTGDEEGLAINGTKMVLEWMKKNNNIPNYCIVGEPTSKKQLGDMVKIGRRGSLSGRLTVYGKQGHVAYPDEAINPFPILIKLLKPIMDENFDQGSETFPKSTSNITSIDSNNSAYNVIPEKVEAKFNIRFNDSFTQKSLEKMLIEYFDSVTKNYQVEFYCNAEPFLTKPGKLVENISKAIKNITNIDPVLSTTGGTSDARFISKFCPVVEFGLIGKTAHHVDERVSIRDIELLSKIYKEFLYNSLYFGKNDVS